MSLQFNRGTVKTLGQRFGSFVSSPAVQGTAAIAPAALAIGGMLMSSNGQPAQPPPPPIQMPPQHRQTQNIQFPDRNMERDETAKAAALRLVLSDVKIAHPLMLAARGAASFLGRNAGNIANGAQVVGTVASMLPKGKPQQPAQPEQPKLNSAQAALKKAMAMVPGGGVVPPMISRPAPSNGPKRTSALDVTPGAGSSFKKATFVGNIKAKANDFGVGAHDALQSGLNTFLTPTTSLDPHKFHAVDDTTPLR